MTVPYRQVIGFRDDVISLDGVQVFRPPLNILERGYALVFDSTGALVKDAALLAPGAEVIARVAQGSFTAELPSRG